MWNLREVHQPNGRPDWLASTRNDVAYLLERAFEEINLGENKVFDPKEKKLEDPLGVCLENLVALEKTDLKELEVQALQAEGFSWLAVDCTYDLSREVAARALGPLAVALGVAGPLKIEGEEGASTPEEIRAAYDQLVLVVRPIVRGEGGSVLDVRTAVEDIGKLQPDRSGTLRLLRATNVLLERAGGRSSLDYVRALQRSLAQRSVGFALDAVLEDSNGRVVGAGLKTRLLIATPEQAQELLVWAVENQHEAVARRDEIPLAALEWIADHGLPGGTGTPGELGEVEEEWCARLVELISGVRGPVATASARALSEVTGRPATIRPEVWLTWWRWERPTPEAAEDVPK